MAHFVNPNRKPSINTPHSGSELKIIFNRESGLLVSRFAIFHGKSLSNNNKAIRLAAKVQQKKPWYR